MPNINELKLAKDLIKIPSITPRDAGAINFLRKQLRLLGFECKILEFKDKKVNQLKIFMQDWVSKHLIFVMQVTLMSFHQAI